MAPRPLVITMAGLAAAVAATVAFAQVPQAERDALLALYDATGGASWTDSSGWGGAAGGECAWYGVTCDESGHVRGLWLPENGLRGALPAEISSLTLLLELNLSGNALEGPIPTRLSDLGELQVLELSDNRMTGALPPELGRLTHLWYLGLGWNRLTGPIPSSYANLDTLLILELSGNAIGGAVPQVVGELSSLIHLGLAEAGLTGSIPDFVTSLPQLENLDLGGNSLSGPVPAAVGGMASLRNLALWGNDFSGELPAELAQLDHLEGLWLGANALTGGVPTFLADMSSLRYLDLGGNQLEGTIPAELGQLSGLEGLILPQNRLEGPIPPELGGMTALDTLELSGNRLTGAIPAELGDLSSLTNLALWGNQLSGRVPDALSRLDQLSGLWLGNNQLEGPVPAWLRSKTGLRVLDLGWNRFTGEIPTWLGELTALAGLSLEGNQLTGSIPAGIGDLANLEILALGWNPLSGALPPEIGDLSSLQELWCDGAGLTGQLPPELGALTQLRELHAAQNDLSGPIPAELGNLANLHSIALFFNRLSGPIPPELGNLENLVFLWLSFNRLEGEIPAELGGLENLLGMGLDLNRLSGEIPPELGGLSSIEKLWLSGNMLSGDLPPELTRLDTLLDGDGIDLRWNLVASQNPAVLAFLRDKQADGGDWESSQTVPPTEVAAAALGSDAVEISWKPIPYSWDEGGYQVVAATNPGGPYREAGRTESKEDSRFVVTGLDPETTYYFVVRSFTLPHGANFNTLVSDPSAMVEATTGAGAACQISCALAVPATAGTAEEVPFVAEVTVTGCDLEAEVSWLFGDGQSASDPSTSHSYAFPGAYLWSFSARAGSAEFADKGTILVNTPDADCGNGSCEEGETVWTCAADCGFDPEATGRVMAGGTDFVVPAAVGGVTGTGGTYWVSEAMLLNPGSSDATVQAVFTPDAEPGSPVNAAPMTVPAGSGVFWPNFVRSVFSDTRNGSVRTHSDEPVVFVSRTFNDLPDGTYGQFLGAVERSRAAGPGTAVYLIGLSHDDRFRTNVILQEVAGVQTTAEVTVFDGDGTEVARRSVGVAAGAKLQKNLAYFGGDGLEHGYMSVETSSGGQLVAIASVIDQQTGDAMTVDALHPMQVELDRRAAAAKSTSPVDFTWSPQVPVVGQQVQFTDLSDPRITSWAWNFGDGETSRDQHPVHVFASAGTYSVVLNVSGGDIRAFTFKQVEVVAAEEAGSVFLLPVVARLAGAAGTVWRTDVWMMNPFASSQLLRLEYRAAGSTAPLRQQLNIGPGELIATEDVVGTLFPAAGDGKGSLAVEAPDGVFVSSRTYNLGPSGTFGQAVPALASGDLVSAPGSALLPKIKSTNDFRCNIGFTDAAGQGATVEVVLYDVTTRGLEPLATRRFTVAAWENKQVDRIFQVMGASGSHEAAAATVEVVSGGPVYAYASNVDNRTGDAEFIPAMRP